MPPPADVRRSETVKRVPRVATMMTTRYVQVEPLTPMGEVAQRLLERKSAWAVVVERDGGYAGIVSTQGVLVALVESLRDEMPVGPARHYLDPAAAVLREDTPLLDAIDALMTGGPSVHALPVMRSQRLVGVVTRLDAVRAAMESFSKGSTPGTGTLYMSALKGSEEKPPF